MSIKLRKQLNLHQAGGNVLDSPGITDINVPSTKPVDPIVTDPPVNPPVTPPVNPPVEQPIVEPTIVEPPIVNPNPNPNNPNPNDPPVPEEKAWHLEASQLVGIELEEDIEIPDSIEGIAQWGTKVGESFAQRAVEREYQELQAKSPEGVELIRWQMQNPNRDTKEFYAAKLGSSEIDPNTLDPKDSERHKDILYKDFMRRGIPEKMAAQYAQNAVDSNSAYEDAKQILNVTAAERQQANAQQEAYEKEQARVRYENFVRDIQAREKTVLESGKLGNVIIPVAERQSFADANYYDARNPEFPGMSEVDIALATMSAEEKDLYRYLAWKKLNIGGLVLAKETSRTVTGIINKNKGGDASRMSGSSNRIQTNDDRRLDSPGN